MIDPQPLGLASFYDGRSIFLTGGTGMVGMAYLARIALDTPVRSVYALVRGGEARFWDFIGEHLQEETVVALQKSRKLIILDGDIKLPNCGLREGILTEIYNNVSIVIHSASTLNLKRPLSFMAENVINPSIAIYKLALRCVNLTKFVFVSTSYASTFMRQDAKGNVSGYDAFIKEDVNPIRSEAGVTASSLEAELSDLAMYGNTPEYSFVEHPFNYSYAKHLTERVLLRDFEAIGQLEKLIIFRSSIIGPAETSPHPFYEKPGSAPITTIAAANILRPPTKMLYSSHTATPQKDAHYDEIPVDIVVNRLIAHVAGGTTGVVHAVAGEERRANAEMAFKNGFRLRRLWWGRPRLQWKDCNWKSEQLCFVGRIFVLLGCAFVFEDAKSEHLWESMGELDRQEWPLWATKGNAEKMENIQGRKKNVRYLAGQFLAKQYGVSPSFAKLICR